MPHFIIAILILLSPILACMLALLVLFIYLFGRPAKYQYHHSICEEDGK